MKLLLFFNLCLFFCPKNILFAKKDTRKRAVVEVEERQGGKKKGKKASKAKLRRSAVFAVAVERKLVKGIDKTTRFLRKTVKTLPKRSSQRLQILEKILNLKMEQATYVQSEEERLFDKKWKIWDKRGRKGPEPKLNNVRSLSHWKSVIKESTLILSEYPKSQDADITAYIKATALQYLMKEKEAAKIFTSLIQKYPNSRIVGDAYASLGDYYFDRGDFRNAKTNYKKSHRYKRSKRYLWSVFKYAWCSYNIGEYKEALKYWKKVVSESGRKKGAGSHLREEALRDMVYAFAELRDIDGAIAYYRAKGGKKFIGPFLNLLSNLLSDQGNYLAAIKVLKRLQRVSPFSPETPESQKEIVALSYALGDLPRVWKELSRFPSLYGVNSPWSKRNSKKHVFKTQSMIKDQMIYYSSVTHQKAIKDNSRSLNKQAKLGYQLFLSSFPKSEEVPTIKYYLADIEYFLKNYQTAGKHYLQIASAGKDKAIRINPKSRKKENMHREVAIEMVRAYVKDFEPEFKALKKRKPDFNAKRPISPRAKNYMLACNRYIKWYPGDKKRVKSCETGIANIYYQSGDKKRAIQYLKLLGMKYATSREGPESIELLIPLIKDDKKELERVTMNLMKIPSYRRGNIGRKIKNLEQASEKESIAKESDLFQRAKKYKLHALKYPKDPEADKLWYNAAVDFLGAGRINDALESYRAIVVKYPKSTLQKESLLQIGKIYDRQFDFNKSSSYYTQFANKFPKSKDSAAVLGRACELNIASGSNSAEPVCLAFANRFPSQDSIILIDRLIERYWREKQIASMTKLILNNYLKRFRLSSNQKILALGKIYRSQKERGVSTGSTERQILSVYGKDKGRVSGEALQIIGELTYRKSSQIVPRYAALRLQGGNIDRLSSSLENKVNALAVLQKEMDKVLATKDPYWGVAALYQLGFANEQLAVLMENPPAIKMAKKEEVVSQLRGKIDLIRNTSTAYYKEAYQVVLKLQIYNDWSIRVFDSLSRSLGSKLKFDDIVFKPDFIGSPVEKNIASVGR